MTKAETDIGNTKAVTNLGDTHQDGHRNGVIVTAHLGSPLVHVEVPVCLVVSHPDVAASP